MNFLKYTKNILNALSYFISIWVLFIVFFITYIIVFFGLDVWLSNNISNSFLWIIVLFIFVMLLKILFYISFVKWKKNISKDSLEFKIITFLKEYVIIWLSILLTYLFNSYVQVDNFIIWLLITIPWIIFFAWYVIFLSKSKK